MLCYVMLYYSTVWSRRKSAWKHCPWPWPLNDLQNVNCRKYSCRFWFKSHQRISSYRVQKTSVAVAFWPWPLTSRPWNVVGVVRTWQSLWQVSLKFPWNPRDRDVYERTHRRTDRQTNAPSNNSNWLSKVLRPTKHIIGHIGDDFYKSYDQTNSVKALKETSWSFR